MMNSATSKLWWLPGAMLALAGVLFMVVAADTGKAGLLVPVGRSSSSVLR